MNLYNKWRNLDKIESLNNKLSTSETTINYLRKELTLKEEIIQSTQKHNLMLTETNNELKELLENEKYEEVVLSTSSSFTKEEASEFGKDILINQCKENNNIVILEGLNKIEVINHTLDNSFNRTEVETKLTIYTKK